MRTFADIINRWKSAEQFAADLGIIGVTARAWRNRNSIPAEHWEALVQAARGRGYEDITLELLASIARAGGTLPEPCGASVADHSHEAA